MFDTDLISVGYRVTISPSDSTSVKFKDVSQGDHESTTDNEEWDIRLYRVINNYQSFGYIITCIQYLNQEKRGTVYGMEFCRGLQ